jgi:NAD(P)-dependent dehydrogenase (short-subunit alcohol dehydrogenase family)
LNKKSGLPSLLELLSLKNKTALITGAGSGIGEAIAGRFAEAGANLELVDIDEERLAKVKAQLERFNVEVCIHKVDLSKKQEIDSLWTALARKAPDVLVNNAGIYPSKCFLTVDDPFLQRVLEVNLKSVFWMCQHMLKTRLKMGGVIINVGSIEAILPLKPELCHYDLSKAAIMALTRALAAEYGKRGFRINVLVPGGVWTQGTKGIAKDVLKFKPSILGTGIEYGLRTPLGRMGSPDEIARMALVLASDFSSYVQGALIVVDGGFLSA